MAKTVAKTTPNHHQLNDIKTIAKKLFELNYTEVTAYNKAAEEDIEQFHTSLSEALPKFSFSAKTWCEIDYMVRKSVAARNFKKCNISLDLSCSSSHSGHTSIGGDGDLYSKAAGGPGGIGSPGSTGGP